MLSRGHKDNHRYTDLLMEKFAERKANNPHYSLRAFARDLGISPAALSQVLSRKRDLAKRSARKVADRLALSPEQSRKMFSEIQGIMTDSFNAAGYRLVQEDVFKFMSNWYSFAILNLAKIPKNKGTPEWVAARLCISVPEAKSALNLLKRLGYIEIQSGKLKRTTVPLTTTNDVPSSALRTYHKQNLKLAEVSIDRDPIHLRDMSSLTMAVHPDEIETAKTAINKFKKKFARLFQSQEPSEVYTLAIQLFPITHKGENI